MKLESFKFQDGKVFWLPEYPEKLDHACTQLPDHDCPICSVYTQDAFNSLASAIEVAPEDVESIARLIWHQLPDNQNYIWQPEKNKVYSAECEMERVEQWALKGTHEWYNDDDERFELHHPDDTDYRQVARLKQKDEIFPAANSHDMKDEDL